MTGAAIGIGIFLLVAVATVILVTARYLRPDSSHLSPELRESRAALRARLDAVLALVPDRPSLVSVEIPDHQDAAAIEAKLLARDPRGALAAAERALAESPDDPRVHLLLARVLVQCDELDAASAELLRARKLGAEGPMADYLEGRTSHLQMLRKTNASAAEVQQSPIPSLITPFEMFILQIERQRRESARAAAVWLANAGNTTLDHDEIAALVADHFAGYYRSLDLLLSAVEVEPGFADALYHTARLALKVGFIDLGRALMDKIEPLMPSSPERQYYERDLSQLRDEEQSSEISQLPPVGPKARRSVSLKVL